MTMVAFRMNSSLHWYMICNYSLHFAGAYIVKFAFCVQTLLICTQNNIIISKKPAQIYERQFLYQNAVSFPKKRKKPKANLVYSFELYSNTVFFSLPKVFFVAVWFTEVMKWQKISQIDSIQIYYANCVLHLPTVNLSSQMLSISSFGHHFD